MRSLMDRVAVVTGAAGGIGLATAEALAQRGCDIALVDVKPEGLEQAAERVRAAGRSATVHTADVADRARMQALAQEVVTAHGRVHVLVNNAGVSVGADLLEHDLDDFEWIVGVNLWGVVHGCKFFLPHLLRQDEAHIVNVSSMFGFIGFPGQTSYCATKFAVRGFSEALYAELSGTRVGVTSVHPGAVRTSIVRDARMTDEEARSRTIEFFERRAMPPEAAAKRILRGIERNRLRVRIAPEAYLTDWIKRLFPVATHRLIAWMTRRGQNPVAMSGGRGGGAG